MRTIVHLSDLHFRRIDDAIVDPLIETAKAIRPDLVVVSGDRTQRAGQCEGLLIGPRGRDPSLDSCRGSSRISDASG